jgi:RNA polymerase-binding transcription factor DksA
MATPSAATPSAATPLTAARQGGFKSLPDTDGGLPVMLKSRALGRLETLVAALRRLEAGAYGLCLGCDQPIPFDRLNVMPEATHCMACRSRA